ncbi:MAG: S8 family serine peptidase, partial [Acholeplasmatales bacterium]|nr:S8 family serine peptidase [Acholeplasmatales bacterium]
MKGVDEMKFKRYLLLGISSICLLAGCNVAEKNSSTIVADEDKISLNINQADLIANVTDNAKYLNPNLLYDLETLDDSDSISAIVTLDREGLTAKYLKNSLGYKSVGEYAQSREAILDSYRMQAQQDALAKELLQKGLIDEVKHSYTTLFNGFSIKTNYGNFKKLERMGIASELTISEVYSLPQSTSDSSNFTVVENVVDVYETGIFNSSGVGYTGNNTAVAILDSGFDIHHTVFKGKSMPSDPLLEMSDVDAVLKSTYASGYQEGLKVTDVYVNSKIPFAYDYADKDSDVAPFDSNHGTHVAGIIGGKDDVITGVAINTQLVLMKVFGDVNNGAITEDILAALEDAVLLGVDAINLSLGTSCGFSRSSDNEYINTVYDSIEAAGISMVVAASNDYSSGYGGAQSNTNKASNPDSATVGSPGSYSTALSVASISGVKSKYITAEDGFVFFFNDANSAGAEQYDFYEMLGIEDGKDVVIDYVTVPGFGNPVNYANIDVKGKIALVKRGDNTFEEKARNAKNAGAIGCIVYNNIGGDIFMNAGNGLEIPFCSISKDDGEYLAKNKTGKLIFNNTNLAGPFMSDFSSWGPNPDLTLKPEITAHGGTILSSVPGGGYDEVSGTSMACPNLCGVVILVRQYLKEKYPNMSSVEIMRMTNQLLMSTATIAMDEYNNPYSVRRQGSGLGNLKNALNTLAYLTVDGQDKAKIELKDDPKETGIYTLKFNINNTSSKVLKYNLGNYTMTETLSTSDSEFVAERAYMLNPSTTISVSGNGSVSGTIITVESNGTAVVEYRLKLSNEEKKYLRQSFENGMYVEGFAILDSMNEDNIDLNIPFLAFFGDWTVAPIFDVDYFQVEAEKNNVAIDDEDKIQADYYETTPLGTYYYSYVIPLGSYVYEIDETKYDPIAASKEHAAMGYNIETINGITTVYAGLLRNAKTMTTTITNNTTGEVIYEHVKKDQIKAHSSGGTQVPAYDLIEFTARDYALENNTQYTFRMEAELDYGDGGVDTNLNNSFEFTFYVDYEAPIITDAEYYAKYDRTLKENRYYVDFYVYDNHYSQSIRPFTLIDGEISSLDEYPTPIYCETKGGITKVTLEITDYMDLLKHGTSVKDEENGSQYPMTNGLGIMVDDYALNANYYYVALPGTDATRLSFTKSNHVFEVGNQINLLDFIQTNDPTFDPDAVGAQDYLARLHWTSSNEDVVRVNNGIVEAVGSGTARVTVQGIANSSAILTASCEFTVLQEYGNNSGSSGDTKFSNDVSLQEISFTHFDVINAFIDGADLSEIGETGDRVFLTSKSSVSFYPSEKIRLGYEIKPWNLDPSRYELIWSSSNEEVATVDATGLVTGISEGSANITLRIKVDGKQSNLLARLRVTIKNEFVIEGSTLIAYKGFGGDVVIPDDEGILYIGSFAFSLYTLDLEIKVDEDDYDANKTADGNTTIESVTIPADVMEVQRYAFYNCPNLKKVTFLGRQKDEKYLTTGIIRDHAFYGCTSLTDINLENVEVIGQRGFYGCTSLETIDLSKIYALGEQAFANCTSLSYVDITTLRNVGRNVFANCTNLTSFDSGEFTNFSEGMFRNTGLTEVHFYYDRIPNRAFEGCNNLTSVIIHNDLIYVGERAFANIKNEYAVTFEKGCQFLYS